MYDQPLYLHPHPHEEAMIEVQRKSLTHIDDLVRFKDKLSAENVKLTETTIEF